MSQILVLYMGSLILRSIGIALVAGICSWKICNVAVRHAVWVVVLGAMLLMPAIDYLLPSSWVPARIQQIAARQPTPIRVVSTRPIVDIDRAALVTPAAATAVPARPKPVDWWRVAAVLYALMALAMFSRLVIGYWKMRKLRRTGSTIASSVWDEIITLHRTRWRIPVLLESDSIQVPMTVGLLRPSVILPVDWKAWDEWKLRAVLLHEVAHIRRCDWGIAVVAAAAKCAYWLSPLSWFLERKLSQLAEQASDDASLSRTQSTTRYAEILLEFAAAAQNGGRLMKGGVAMAQQNMKARIERVLGKPQSGTGFVRIAGWALVMILAIPVIYSAAALQVASEPAPAPVAKYVAEFGRNPLSQGASPQSSTQAAPPAGAIAQQGVPSPAAESELRKVQQEHDLLRESQAQAELEKALEGKVLRELESQKAADQFGTVEFLKAEEEKLLNQLATLELQTELAQQGKAIPPPPPASALLDLPDNEGDLRAYLEKLAQLRVSPNGNTFSVSITGIQGRTISMKIAGQDYSLGCQSCSFFAGESAVISASSTPTAPGVFVRLSSDGRDLYITCHATKCSVAEYEILGDGSENVSTPPRQLEMGLSELFGASKRLRIVILRK